MQVLTSGQFQNWSRQNYNNYFHSEMKNIFEDYLNLSKCKAKPKQVEIFNIDLSRLVVVYMLCSVLKTSSFLFEIF